MYRSDNLDRRAFLCTTAAITAATMAHGAESPNAIRLGGPCFLGSKDPEALAKWHVERGYRAAYCPGHASLDDPAGLATIESAFAKHGVVIAEVGRWVNLMEADPAKRKANLDLVTQGLALADAVGTKCCVDICGSRNPDDWAGPHPDNVTDEFFDAAVENARKIIDAVKPTRAKFTYEMMPWALPDSTESYLRMIKAIDRPGFSVHLDPCNLINSPRRYWDNGAMITECIEKLGPWVVSCHAKDMGWEPGAAVRFDEVLPGTGGMDYAAYLRGLARLGREIPLMIEHLDSEAEYDAARAYIQGKCGELGVAC